MTQRTKRALALLATAIVGFVAWLGYIGYFGGDTYFEVPAQTRPSAPARTVAVIFSGDMGFRIGMGPRIADRLADDGIPVLGVSSLAYFRHQRTPAEVRTFVAGAVHHAVAFAHADRVILIGQSFGADMLQVGAEGLPESLRNKVELVALIVPGNGVIFRASPAELFNWVSPDAEAISTARKLDWTPVLCVYGKEEDNSLCPMLRMDNVRRVALPGGHALHSDADALYAVLKAKIDTTLHKGGE